MLREIRLAATEPREDGSVSEMFAVIVPERGGIMTNLSIDGRELFYLDRTTLEDRTKNIRGGCPILFPSPGRLASDSWRRAGRSGQMKQHGFARNLPWTVVKEEPSSVVLELVSSEATRAEYPWDFALQCTYRLLPGLGAHIDMQITNRSEQSMPFGLGYHPYFFIEDREKATARVATRARRAFDNAATLDVALDTHPDFTAKELDLHLVEHGGSQAELTATGVRLARLRGSPELEHWVLWTLRGKNFICVEPWTSPANALNTGKGLLTLEPGATRTIWLEITR